jgi:MutS domain V
LNLDAVFAAIDRTESTVGQQLLYHRLRCAPVASDRDAFEALAVRMATDRAIRERAQVALAHLQDPWGYHLWRLAQPGSLETRRWHVLFPAITFSTVAVLMLSAMWPRLLLVVPIVTVANLLLRIATAQWVGAALVGSFRQVAPLVNAATTLASIDDEASASITATLRSDVPTLRRLRRYARWVTRDRTTAAAGGFGAMLLEYLNLLFLLDLTVLYFAARDIRASGTSLLRVIAAVGNVDAAISVASFRIGAAHWTRPRFLAAGSPATFTDVRHPLVDAAVPNSIRLGPPHGILVTGSNMSGKTTFLRTLGVTVVLAQTINTCFAAIYEAPVLHVRSCIGRADDLSHGKSYYQVEVEAVLALVQASRAREPHLFLFDELFRGTNAVERIAAAEAVLNELTANRTHIIVTATHDGELVDLLRHSYVPYHFTDSLGPRGLVFEYRLQPGPATTRNAITLLKIHGAPDSLVSRALARAEELDRARTIRL